MTNERKRKRVRNMQKVDTYQNGYIRKHVGEALFWRWIDVSIGKLIERS